MIVADLIRLLRDYDPNAIVLIPRDAGLGDGTEMLADVVPVPSACFSNGPGATSGGVRLSGLPAATMIVVTGVAARKAISI
jgi:hypothetical protein